MIINDELIREIFDVMLLAGFCIIVALIAIVAIYDLIRNGLNEDKVKYPWEKEEKRAAKQAAKRARERKWYESK